MKRPNLPMSLPMSMKLGWLFCFAALFSSKAFPEFAHGGRVLQVQAVSDCAAGCRVASAAYQRIGGMIFLTPRSASSSFLIECTFSAAVQLVPERNTTGSFQLFEETRTGPRAVGHETSLYTLLSSFGAAASAPATHRVLVQNRALQPRVFALNARTAGYQITPAVTVTGEVCTVTEIED